MHRFIGLDIQTKLFKIIMFNKFNLLLHLQPPPSSLYRSQLLLLFCFIMVWSRLLFHLASSLIYCHYHCHHLYCHYHYHYYCCRYHRHCRRYHLYCHCRHCHRHRRRYHRYLQILNCFILLTRQMLQHFVIFPQYFNLWLHLCLNY